MQVRPEYASRYPGARVEHVMMIAPVDADVNEAEHIAHEHRNERRERFQAIAVRNLHLEHHDRYDDRDNSVAEPLESVLDHTSSPLPMSPVAHLLFQPFPDRAGSAFATLTTGGAISLPSRGTSAGPSVLVPARASLPAAAIRTGHGGTAQPRRLKN